MQSLVGILSVIPAASLPVGLLKLCLWTRWFNGSGTFKQTARILAPDQKTVIGSAEVNFELQNVNGHATNVHFFTGIQFKEFGLYHVEIALDGKVVVSYPFLVAQAAQKQGAPAKA